MLPSPQQAPPPLPPPSGNDTVHLVTLPRNMEVTPHIHPNPQVHLKHRDLPQTRSSLPLTQAPWPLSGYRSTFLSGPAPLQILLPEASDAVALQLKAFQQTPQGSWASEEHKAPLLRLL